MKPYLLTALTVLTLAATGPSFAANEAHDHGHGTTSATLQLNAGKRWETDTALRQAMRNIRQTMAGALHDIHENRLLAKGYGKLAQKVEAEVGNIVANCKLEPKADAMLHLVIADIGAGTDTMAGKDAKARPALGLVMVAQAVNQYGNHFDHPGFKPIRNVH